MSENQPPLSETSSTPGTLPGEVPTSPPVDKAAIIADWRAEKEAKSASSTPTSTVNIGPHQRLLRYLMGILLLLVSIWISGLLIWLDSPFLVRLLVFIPYWFAFVCLFQGAEKVCVMHARNGTCNLDQGVSKIDDHALVSRLRVKATWIYFKAFYSALFWVLLTALLSKQIFGGGGNE